MNRKLLNLTDFRNTMRFSERMGINKPKVNLQKEGIDIHLRNGIWNYLVMNIFDNFTDFPSMQEMHLDQENRRFIRSLWINFFKSTIDTCPSPISAFKRMIRNWFFDANWEQIYDFLEFVIQEYCAKEIVEKFVENMNIVLKRELSAYRIVSSKIIPITSDIEMKEMERAMDSPIKEVNKQLKRALELLSNRKNPDYKNSIKESISAVETLCKIISENPKASLGDALSKLEKSGKIKVHGALQVAFTSLYGYTSNADGIRHALMEESSLDQEDALFMLTSCSAFINYLIVKSLKAGKNLL